MAKSFFYKLNSGKPFKLLDFIKNFVGLIIPNRYYRSQLHSKLNKAAQRPDYTYIMGRVNYYIHINTPWNISMQNITKREHSTFHYTGTLKGYKRKMFHTAYYFDQHEITRWFSPLLRWNFIPGDVYFTPDSPTIVKSRLLTDNNQNSVILKLDKLRHFMFVRDFKAFKDKQNKVIFRGKIRQSRVRKRFLQLYFNHPMFNCGVIGKNEGCPEEWMTSKETIREHLNYKFIMALEGNDVASNLKWVMSSNSIAVMTRPTCETWFMEGTLIPDYHYIEVKEDFSDLAQKIQYYIDHPSEAEAIIKNAHEYVDQFRNKEREELISLLVLDRYFKTSGQK